MIIRRALSLAPLIALSFAALPVAWASQPGLLPAATDLHADGVQAARLRKPIVILFSLPGCSYCAVVRKNYLAPLLHATAAARPIIREVDISADTRVIGFQREALSHSELAAAYRVRVAPKVLFLDGSGKPLAEPIVGGDVTGLYGGYLDNAFVEAARKLGLNKAVDTEGDKR